MIFNAPGKVFRDKKSAASDKNIIPERPARFNIYKPDIGQSGRNLHNSMRKGSTVLDNPLINQAPKFVIGSQSSTAQFKNIKPHDVSPTYLTINNGGVSSFVQYAMF